MKHESRNSYLRNILSILFSGSLLLAAIAFAQTGAWLTHSHDEQHTALATVGSQALDSIHWHVPVDLHPPQGEIFIHYGSPLVTAANTVIVPVKTGANAFRVEAHNGATGKLIWKQATGYKVPQAGFTPAIGPTIFGNNLYIPDVGGTVLVRQNPDQAGGALSHLYFFGENNYNQNPKLYNKYIQIDTPLTTDTNGNLYFGFEALGSTPANLVSGLARIAANGTGTWVSAAALSGDSSITEVSISCAPALSPDGSILYVAVDDGSAGYLLAVNSATLALINKVRLVDPASKEDAWIYSGSSATPTVPLKPPC